jgi:predicted dehydrogenase
MRGDLAQFWHSQFHFADHPYVVEATSGTIDQQGRPFEHGFEIHLERATLVFDFAVIGGEGRMVCEPTLLDDKGRVKHPKMSDGDPMTAFQGELREVLRAIRTGQPSPILDGALARDAIVLCQKQTESLRRNRPVRVV